MKRQMSIAVEQGQWFQALIIGGGPSRSDRRRGFRLTLSCWRRLHHFVQVVNEVATWSVRAESNGMVGPAQVRLVFRVPGHGPEFGLAMSELAFFAVFAGPVFGKWSAQFRLVAVGVDLLGSVGIS